MSSLSCCPIPQMKKRLAYRLYTILESADAEAHQNKKQRRPSRRRDGRTFVLEEVAHARSPGQHELCDILYNLGCRTGRGTDESECVNWTVSAAGVRSARDERTFAARGHGRVPFREADLALSRDEEEEGQACFVASSRPSVAITCARGGPTFD